MNETGEAAPPGTKEASETGTVAASRQVLSLPLPVSLWLLCLACSLHAHALLKTSSVHALPHYLELDPKKKLEVW